MITKPDPTAERERRRLRDEQGRSPVHLTKRSKNKGRAAKRPNKGDRAEWKKELCLT